MIDFLTILNRLNEAEVDFILVGALSAAIQGAQISTVDVDIVHSQHEPHTLDGQLVRVAFQKG